MLWRVLHLAECVGNFFTIFFDKVLYHATMYINEEICHCSFLYLAIELSF